MSLQVNAMIDEGIAEASGFNIAPVSTVGGFDAEIERKCLDETIIEARAAKADADRAIDALDEQIAALQHQKTDAVSHWNEAHVKESKALRRLTELTEQETRA